MMIPPHTPVDLAQSWEQSPGDKTRLVLEHADHCASMDGEPCDCEPSVVLELVDTTDDGDRR